MKMLFTSLLLSMAAMTASAQAQTLNCADDQRLFSHPLSTTGDVCVPKNPQRIVAVDMSAAELTLLTGKELVGAANWILAEMSIVSPEFHSVLPHVENVGYPANIEKMLNLKPDLILAVGNGAGVHQSIDVKAAQKIAPLVVADPIVYDDWKVSTQFWAAALNEMKTYEKLLGNYETRIAETKAALGDKVNQQVSIVALGSYKTLWLKSTPPAAVISDIGFQRPAAQDYDKDSAKGVYKDVRYPKISEETLNLIDGDVIFGFVYPAYDQRGQKKEQRAFDKLNKNPLWNNLNAVKANNFYLVGGHWWRSTSYLLASKVLDDVASNMLGKPLPTPMLTYPLTE